MLGLTFDIVGAFLVSVEAIKVENLRMLRDRVLRRLEEYTLSPRITFVEKSRLIRRSDSRPVPAERYPGIFMGLHYVAGLALVVLVNRALGGRVYRVLFAAGLWTLKQRWYVVIALLVVFVLWGIVAGLWMLGELVHMSVTQAVRLPVKAVDFIDARTPDGTVGILGFVLLLIGFAFQMYGAYSGRPEVPPHSL